jgi:hypothetical protein
VKSNLLLGTGFARCIQGLLFALLNLFFFVLYEPIAQGFYAARLEFHWRVATGVWGTAALGIMLGLFSVFIGLLEMRQAR